MTWNIWHFSKWFGLVRRRQTKKPRPSKRSRREVRLELEQLETRMLFAYFTSISTAATANVSLVESGTTATFTATGSGANINVSDILTELQKSSISTAAITDGSSGTDGGGFNWNSGTNLDFSSIGGAKTLKIASDPTDWGGFSFSGSIYDSSPGSEKLSLEVDLHANTFYPSGGINTNGGTITVNTSSNGGIWGGGALVTPLLTASVQHNVNLWGDNEIAAFDGSITDAIYGIYGYINVNDEVSLLTISGASATGSGDYMVFANTGAITTTGTLVAPHCVQLNAGGTISLGADVNVTGTGANDLVYLYPSTGGVNQTAGTLTAPNLVLQGAGNFTLPTTSVETLSGAVLGSVSLHDSSALAVGEFNVPGALTVIGLTTGNGSTAGGTVSIGDDSTITVNQPINTQSGTGGVAVIGNRVTINWPLTTGAGYIYLNAGTSSFSGGSLSLDPNSHINLTTGGPVPGGPLANSSPYLAGQAAAFQQDIFNNPLGPVFTPFAGGAGSSALTGSFAFDAADTMSFSVNLTGSDANYSYTFSDAGSIVGTLHLSGTFTASARSFLSYMLTEHVSDSWTFTQTTHGGSLVTSISSSGTETFDVDTTFLSSADPYHVRAFEWLTAVQRVSGVNNLNLTAFAWNSLSVAEYASSSAATYVENGLATLTQSSSGFVTDDVNQPPGGLPPINGLASGPPGDDTLTSAVASYTFTQTGSYSLTQVTNALFTVIETGTQSAGCFSLGCYAFTSSGTVTSLLTETGTDLTTGSATAISTTLLNSGLESGTGVNQSQYSFTNQALYTYNENRTAAETYAEFGTFGGGSFNLPTVTRQDSATGSYHFTSAGTESFSGTATDSQTTSGSVANANPFGYQSFSSADSSTTNSGDQYSFSGNDYYTNSNQGTNTFASLETGSFAGNSYGLSTASYQWSGSSTLASQETSVQSSTGTGSSTQYAGSTGSGNSLDDGTTSPGSGSSLFTSTDSYAFGGTDTSTASSSGSGNFSLTAQGSYAAGSWALSSITSAGSGTDVGTVTDNSLQTSSGTGTTTSSQAGTNSATTAYAGINGNLAGSYSNSSLDTQVYGGSDTSNSTTSSSDTYSGFQAGSFAHGSYALNSVLLQDSSLAHSTESDTSVQTATGGGLSTSTSSGNGLDTTVFGGASFSSTGTTSTSGTESYVFTSSSTLTSNSSATDSSTSTQAGCFTGARFAFTSVIMQDSGNDSYSDASNALETRNGAGNSLLTSISGDASADTTDGTDFTSNGNDGDFYTSFESYTFAGVNTTTGTDSGTDCYSNYQAAQELGGSYALSSVLLQATGTFGSNQTVLTSESPTLGSGSATDSATFAGTQTTTLPMYDTNSTGSTSAQSNDTYSYIMSSTETATSASAGSYTNYQAGSFSAGSFAFGSVLFKDGGNDATTDIYTSLATYNGGGTSSSTFQGHGAETSTFANNTVGANGTTTSQSNESYAFTNTVHSTDSSTSADTYSDYQAGTNANDSYAFNSMVNQDQDVSLDSYTEIGVQSQNGNAYSVETFNGLDDDTENGGGTNVLNNYLASSSTYLTTSAYTLTQHSTDTSQSFLAGTYAADTDSLSCAALSDNGVDTYSSQALGTTSSTALSILTSTGSQSLNGDGTSALPGGTYSFNANNSYTSLVSSTNYDNESGIDTYSSFGLGNFAAGSYAFQSMGSSDNSTSTSSTGGTDSQTDTGVGTYASTGTTTAQAPVGYAGTATLQIPVSAVQNDYFQFTNYSNDSYSNTETDSNSSFGLGVQSYGEVNLSCLVAIDNGTTTSNMTATANESYSGNGNTTQANIGTTYGTYSSTSLYTLSSTSSSTQSQTSTATTSDYQAGTSTAGEAAFNSVLFLNGDTDASTYTEDGTWSTSGGDSIAYAFGTYNFHQSGAFAGTDTHHLLTTSNESDTGYQAGCFTGDSYAFASVLFLSQGSGTKTAHENAMNSYSGVANSSSVLTTTTGGGSVGTIQVNSAYGIQTYSSYFTQTDDTAGTNSSTLYQAGSFANDSYAFTSYVSTDRGMSGDTYSVYQTQSVQSYISTLTEINGSSSLATDAWNNVQQAGSITSFTSFDTFQTNGYSTASYNDYQAGAFSNGSASFSSVVQQQATSDSYSAAESYGMFQGTDLFASGSAVYTTTYVGTSSGSSDQAVYTLTTVSATERGFDSASTLQAGSFAAGSYAFATVVFTSSGSYAQTFDSEVLTTWPNYSADVYSTTDPAGSNGSSVDSWLGTGSNENFATQSSSFNLYEAGNYAAGSYAFNSMVHTANANSNTSYAAIYTQTTFSSEVDPSNNEVTTSWITSTANGGAMSSSSLYEAGLYDPVNGWSLSSLVESQGTIADDDDVYSSDSTFANFLDGYTTTDDSITTTTDDGTFALYAAGSYAAGSYSFASFAMQQTWVSPSNGVDTTTDTRSGMTVSTGTSLYCYTLEETGAGQVGSYTMTSDNPKNIEWDTYDLDGHLTNVQTYAADVSATHSRTFDLSSGQPFFPAYNEGASWRMTPQTSAPWVAPEVALGGIQIANMQLAAQATWTIGTTPASRAAAAGMLASMPPPPTNGPTSDEPGDAVADAVDDSPIVGELFEGQTATAADDDTTANEDQWIYGRHAYLDRTLFYNGSGENAQLEKLVFDSNSQQPELVKVGWLGSIWNGVKEAALVGIDVLALDGKVIVNTVAPLIGSNVRAEYDVQSDTMKRLQTVPGIQKRAEGGLQVMQGGSEILLAPEVGAAAPPVGGWLFFRGLENIGAGLAKIITGKDAKTGSRMVAEGVSQAIGASQEKSETVGAVVDGVQNLASVAASFYNIYRAWAKSRPIAPVEGDANFIGPPRPAPPEGSPEFIGPPRPPTFPTTTPENSPLLRRYLSESGGRWGNTATRQLNHQLATDLERQGFQVTGAGRGPEEWFAGPGGGTSGGTFVDITATNGTQTIRIQTVTTLADGITLTADEAAAAARIRARFPNDRLILVSKRTGQVIP